MGYRVINSAPFIQEVINSQLTNRKKIRTLDPGLRRDDDKERRLAALRIISR